MIPLYAINYNCSTRNPAATTHILPMLNGLFHPHTDPQATYISLANVKHVSANCGTWYRHNDWHNPSTHRPVPAHHTLVCGIASFNLIKSFYEDTLRRTGYAGDDIKNRFALNVGTYIYIYILMTHLCPTGTM